MSISDEYRTRFTPWGGLPEHFACSLQDAFIKSCNWKKIPDLGGGWKKFVQRLLSWDILVGFLRGLGTSFDVDALQPNGSEISGVLLLMLNLLCKMRHRLCRLHSHRVEFTTEKPYRFCWANSVSKTKKYRKIWRKRCTFMSVGHQIFEPVVKWEILVCFNYEI